MITQFEADMLNSQVDYAIEVLKSMVMRIKGYNLSTEEFNEILHKKINLLQKEKEQVTQYLKDKNSTSI